jgi:hypothetical protein
MPVVLGVLLTDSQIWNIEASKSSLCIFNLILYEIVVSVFMVSEPIALPLLPPFATIYTVYDLELNLNLA